MAPSIHVSSNLTLLAGLLGSIISICVYLAPIPTFRTIRDKKSSDGFSSIPYMVAMFSATIYLYYAFLKGNLAIIITINVIGLVFQAIYLAIYLIYATWDSKVFTARILVGFNLLAFGAIVGTTMIFMRDHEIRVNIVGWICSGFSVLVFAAPLSIVVRVIRTHSVEFMPFPLSACLTLCAVAWFFYGLFVRDFYIAAPNVLGFFLGVAQMVLYRIYKQQPATTSDDEVV